MRSAQAADEGMYNAGYRLQFAGGGPARAFLKVGPPADVPVLTYEHDLLRTEARVLGELADAGLAAAPRVLAADFSRRIVDRDGLFMTWLDGELLSKVGPSLALEDRVALRRQVGRIAGEANRIAGPFFGYPGQPALQASSWAAAFRLMIGALFDDAERFGADLPTPSAELARQFERALPLLDGAQTAQLVHYDLWDGNVLVRETAAGWSVSGVIDWERAFYGDPLAEVVSLSLFAGPEERTALLQGLAEGWGRPWDAGGPDERRLALYRAYLWLIMIEEAKPRGFGGSILLPSSRAARRLQRDLAAAA